MQAKEWIVILVILVLIGLGFLIYKNSKILGGIFIFLGSLFAIMVAYFTYTAQESDYNTLVLYPAEQILYSEKGIYATYETSRISKKNNEKNVKTTETLLLDAEVSISNVRIILSDRMAFTPYYAPLEVFYWNQKDLDSLDWKKNHSSLKPNQIIEELDPILNADNILKPSCIIGDYRFGKEDGNSYLILEYQSRNIPNKKEPIKIWFKNPEGLEEILKKIKRK